MIVVFVLVFSIQFAFGQLSFQAHAVLKNNLDGGLYIAEAGMLKFKYVEEYADKDNQPYLTYNIHDNSNAVVMSSNSVSLSVNQGDNRYQLDVSTLPVGIYRLEVINAKNEKRYLRFQLSN